MSRSSAGTADPPRTDPPSYRVVEALAAVRGCDERDIEPLGRYIDLEHLDDLIESSCEDVVVRATVGADRVEVRGDGSVRVR